MARKRRCSGCRELSSHTVRPYWRDDLEYCGACCIAIGDVNDQLGWPASDELNDPPASDGHDTTSSGARDATEALSSTS